MLRRRTLLASLLIGLISNRALATAQIPEEIFFEGKTEMLFSEPLNQYLLQRSNLAKLEPYLSKERCTGSWRGYRGVWELKESRLFLVRLETDACNESPKQVPLGALFPATKGPVFAKWYTGTLIIPLGKQVKYAHMGYESQYERYIVYTVVEGMVTQKRETSTPPK